MTTDIFVGDDKIDWLKIYDCSQMPGATLEARPMNNKDGFAVKRGMKGKTKPLHFWTTADVNKWLRKHGGLYFELYGDLLSKHEVTGKLKKGTFLNSMYFDILLSLH